MDGLMLNEWFVRLRERKGGKQTVVLVNEETIRATERFKLTHLSNGDPDYLFLILPAVTLRKNSPPRGGEYLHVLTAGSISIRRSRVSKTQVQRAVKNAAVEAGVMDRGEDRFHKRFTPHTYRTVFTTLIRNQGMKQHVLRYIRGDAASETMDTYTRVDREEACREYLDCIKTPNL